MVLEHGWQARMGKPALLILLLLSLIIFPAPAAADPVPPPPNPSNIDSRGVNLTSGELILGEVDVSIGPSDYHGLQFARQYVGWPGWRIANVPTISGSTTNPIVSYGGRSIPFTTVSGVYVPQFQDGSTLNSTRTTFTASDGTVIQFGVAGYQYPMFAQTGSGGLGTSITYPDGTIWTFTYNQASYTAVVPGCYVDQFGTPCMETYYVARLSSITSSTGYQIKLTYASNTVSDTASFSTWSSITKATALNNSIEYCNPAALSCSFTNTWPQASYTVDSTPGLYTRFITKSDPESRTTTYNYTSARLSGIRRPGAATDAITYGYNATTGKVVSVATGGGTWTYGYPTGTQTTVTDPLSNITTINYASTGLVTSVVDALSQTTTYDYCTSTDTNCPVGLLKKVTMPGTDPNSTTVTYDTRGNQTSVTRNPHPSLGGTPIVTYANYPSSCTGSYTLKNCNKPLSTTDAKGNVTNYTFDGNHGGLTQLQQPAPSGTTPRPTVNVTYTATYARYLTGASTWSNSAAIYVPTGSTTCRIATTCSGTADERVTTTAYPGSSVANNALPSSVTIRSGNSGVVETTTVTYDNYGDVASVDGPLSGTSDTRVAFYNLARQQTGAIGPSSSSYLNLTSRITYDSGGRPYLAEQGYTSGQTSSALSSMTVIGSTVTTYDTLNRPLTVTSKGTDGTAYALAQTSYDVAGQVSCVATRMNPAIYGSLPASACSLGTQGSYGPDRITSYHYDAVGRADTVTTGYGTTDAATEQTLAFTTNGLVSTVKDALNNCTQYEYDGFDRLIKTHFPSPTVPAPACSMTGDYEQYGLDANGNITTFRTRRGETLNLTYDNLDRLTLKDVPTRSGLASTHTRDVYFGYDLFGDTTYARFDSATGDGIGFTFDALGRRLTETQALDGTSRTITSAYDAANNRTYMTFPDGNYVYNVFDIYNRPYAAYLNGSSPLFHTPFDNAGRLDALYRWNISTGSWSNAADYVYDSTSRLSALYNTLTGTTYNTATTFGYNPAGQIVGRSEPNDAYAWTGQVNVSPPRPYTANGLNQYSAVNSTSFTYDTDGNLTSDGTNSYVYDVENRLVTATVGSTSATLRYDPLGRLYEVNGSATGITRFLYDGDDDVAEYDGSGNMIRRFVHGGGAGHDPLVWFESQGVADSARRYLYPDERGSIVAVTDSSGAVISGGISTYDEFGIPGASNKGRFQYTGQAWLPELGMYYYKARMYSPTLGRFMQTDPIGYGDGVNMYRYVHNDPVNWVDPSGLADFCVRGNDVSNCPPGPPPPITVNGDPCSVIRCFDVGSLMQAVNADGRTNQNPGNTDVGGVSGHYYDTTERICRVPLSQDQRGKINRATAVPDGMLNPGRSAGTYPVGGWLFGIIPITGGYVTTRFSANGNIAVNTTTSAHLFVGTITRIIYSNSNGTFIRTIGSGDAGSSVIGRTRDELNEAMGPGIFREANGLARMYAQELNPSC